MSGPLVRVALHQSRLVAPGLSLDARGVAIGPSGLVLFASVDRLVSFLAALSREGPLDELELTARIVRSKLGNRAAAIELPLPSSDRLDALTSTAALVDAHVFTGAGRHWVEAPGPSAPFGFDLTELEPVNEGFVVYHRAYVQAFVPERTIDLARLVLRLEPYPDPSAVPRGACLLLAEWGLGGMLISYLARSGVRARVGVVQQPPETPLDDEPVRHVLVEVDELPPRMAPLFRTTPGLVTFVPVAAGAAVEAGYSHPVSLGALAAFRGPGLALIRGRGERPIVMDAMPTFAPVEALARVRVGDTTPLEARADAAPPAMQIALGLVPSLRPLSDVTASWIEAPDLPLLRRMLYAMPRTMLEGSQIAIAKEGAFIRAARGTDPLPLGVPYRSLLPALYAPAGHDPVPAVSPEVLAAAVDAPPGHVVLLRPGATPLAIDEQAFVPLARAVLAGPGWAPLSTLDLDDGLDEALPLTLVVEDPGSRPLADVENPPR